MPMLSPTSCPTPNLNHSCLKKKTLKEKIAASVLKLLNNIC